MVGQWARILLLRTSPRHSFSISPFFFHSRNVTLSASGVDPDITLEDALSQIPRISATTNITQSDLSRLVGQNIERTSWILGDEYVNVLRLNLALIQEYQSTFQKLDPALFAQ